MRSLSLLALLLALFQAPARAETDDETPTPTPRLPVTTEENLSVSTKPVASRKKLGPRGESKLFSWWSPEAYVYSVGYEKAGSAVAALGADNLTFGMWLSENIGVDAHVGYTKAAGDTQESITVAETGTTTKSRVTVTELSGTTGAANFTLGAGIKYRAFQNSWFQFNYGLLVAFTTASKKEGTTGKRTETIADLNDAGTKTVQETAGTGSGLVGFANVSEETKSKISVGPRIGTEFYLKWFPHLAIGFASGILATFGGETTTVVSQLNKTQTFVGGNEVATPATTPTVTTVNKKPGSTAGTFGIGGTQFALTGVFSIRYVW